jgi:hypothetical protein
LTSRLRCREGSAWISALRSGEGAGQLRGMTSRVRVPLGPMLPVLCTPRLSARVSYRFFLLKITHTNEIVSTTIDTSNTVSLTASTTPV